MTPGLTASGRRRIAPYAAAGLLVLAAALMAGAGGYAWRARASQPAGPLEQVRIASVEYAGSCPILVARRRGYFEDEGLSVAIQSYTTGKDALDAALRGQADLGTCAESPIVFAVMNGQPVAVIATLFVAERDYGIVGRRDRGIVTPSDLKGMRIGVTLNTAGHFVLDAFLNRYKLSTSDVEVRDLKPEEFAAAMARGDIDAVSTWEPFLRALREQLGANASAFSVEDVYDSLFNISGTQDYVAKHPKTIEKVLRALIRGSQYCERAPDAASEIVAMTVKTDTQKLKDLWPSYRFTVTLDQGLLLALEDQTRWVIKNKLAKRTDMPNYLNHVYLNGLQVVAPESVTVIY